MHRLRTKMGLDVRMIGADAAAQADILFMLVPDQVRYSSSMLIL